MRAIAGMALAAALTGCTGVTEPRVEIRKVEVPVAVSCVPTPPVVAPAFVDTDAAIKAAPTPFDRAKLYVVGRLQHWAYESELLAALKGCAG